MAVSRVAARLFREHGVAATSGDDIARAAGVSTRTVWRYFRAKEGSVEPLLEAAAYRFLDALRRWEPEQSLEEFLLAEWRDHPPSGRDLEDDLLATHMIAMSVEEPAVRAAWLMACGRAEVRFRAVVARRLQLDEAEQDVRLCAAAAVAAIRVVNEEVSTAALRRGVVFTPEEVYHRLAEAVRASTWTTGLVDPRPSGSA